MILTFSWPGKAFKNRVFRKIWTKFVSIMRCLTVRIIIFQIPVWESKGLDNNFPTIFHKQIVFRRKILRRFGNLWETYGNDCDFARLPPFDALFCAMAAAFSSCCCCWKMAANSAGQHSPFGHFPMSVAARSRQHAGSGAPADRSTVKICLPGTGKGREWIDWDWWKRRETQNEGNGWME